MADVTDASNTVARCSREMTASRPEGRRALDPVAREVLVRVAYEMRQPLSAVSAVLNVIKDDSDPSRRQYACRVLERQCTRLSRLADDLVVVARTGRDITGFTEETIDLPHVIVDVTRPAVDATALPAAVEPRPPKQTSATLEHVRRMLDRIEQSYA
jgi:signal transduction histidine kinase